jgi:hypothetical protein
MDFAEYKTRFLHRFGLLYLTLREFRETAPRLPSWGLAATPPEDL